MPSWHPSLPPDMCFGGLAFGQAAGLAILLVGREEGLWKRALSSSPIPRCSQEEKSWGGGGRREEGQARRWLTVSSELDCICWEADQSLALAPPLPTYQHL